MVLKADKHHSNTRINSDDRTFWNLLLAAVMHMPHRDLSLVCKCPHCGMNKGLSYLRVYSDPAEKCKSVFRGVWVILGLVPVL